MANYNQQVLDKLNDPNTPREEYMRLWQEWQDIVWQQKVLDEAARERSKQC